MGPKPKKTLDQYPSVVAQWHPTKNTKQPSDYGCGSGKKVWWLCPVGDDHEWDAAVGSRVNGAGCPICSGRRSSRTRNLAVQFPNVADQWDPKRNGDLTPFEVTSGSQTKRHWVCPEGPDHRWETTPQHRTGRGQGCPYCVNHLLSVTNSVTALRPDLVQEWHLTRNGTLMPDQVLAGADNVTVWWKCSKGSDHEWQATPNQRRRADRCTCPFCNNLKASVTNRLDVHFPELAAQWHPTKNVIPVSEAVAASGKSVWWQCESGHEWQATLSTRSRLHVGCRYCAGLAPTKDHNLAVCCPELAKQWHPTKNGQLRPEEVSPNTSKKYWWKCDVADDHEWQETPSDRNRDCGCPCCSNRKVSVTNRLDLLRPDLAVQWDHERNAKSPSDYTVGTHTRVYWRCDKGPDHHWAAPIYKRTGRGDGCPYCANKKLSITNCLATRNPELAKEWHPTKNGQLTPKDVISGAAKKVWWQCSLDPRHSWPATLNARDSGQGTGCPTCKNKTQRKLTDLVRSFFPDTESEKFLPCLGGLASGGQHLDIYVPSLRLAIEYNGRQHYEPIKFFGGIEGFEHRLELDARKRRLCAEGGIIMIEWPYTDPIDEAALIAKLEAVGIAPKKADNDEYLKGLPLFDGVKLRRSK